MFTDPALPRLQLAAPHAACHLSGPPVQCVPVVSRIHAKQRWPSADSTSREIAMAQALLGRLQPITDSAGSAAMPFDGEQLLELLCETDPFPRGGPRTPTTRSSGWSSRTSSPNAASPAPRRARVRGQFHGSPWHHGGYAHSDGCFVLCLAAVPAGTASYERPMTISSPSLGPPIPTKSSLLSDVDTKHRGRM